MCKLSYVLLRSLMIPFQKCIITWFGLNFVELDKVFTLDPCIPLWNIYESQTLWLILPTETTLKLSDIALCSR